MSTRLSKSRYQKGLQCPRALWLTVHAPDLADPISESQQWVFDQGTEVGRLAHGLFPGGVEVEEDHRHQAEALATTERLLDEGASVLFEPAFFFDDVLVRVDILVRVGEAWDLYELKSSGKLKPEHVTDAAVQTYVLEGCGLAVRRSHVVHLNTSYTYGGGEHDLARLFVIENVTSGVRAYLPDIPAQLAAFQAMLAAPDEPAIRVGARCRTPYACDFAGHCHAFLPAEDPVTDLPYLSEPALHALLDMGVTCIRDIPADFDRLSANQLETVRVVQSGRPSVDRRKLTDALSSLTWPVYHLDFETIMPALPLWAGTRPYQTIPFQFSIHVHHEDGSHEHREYLHVDGSDPRRPLAERMLADLGEAGSVTHYTSYEDKRLTELAADLPELADRIAAVRARLFDLEPVVKRCTKHPDAHGRTSIKHVLPAWCPDMTYAGMNIADGQTASVRYLKAARGLVDADIAERTYADLIEYCGLDTYAMVRLLDALRERAG